MANIKQSDIEASKTQIKEAIRLIESVKNEQRCMGLGIVIDHLNEALCNLCDGSGDFTDEDLFPYPEKQPENLRLLLESYEQKYSEGMDYWEIEQMLNEVKELGYTFDYGLDAVPFNLRLINE